MLNFSFSNNTLEFLKIIAKTAALNNVKLYIVGGFVRDYFLGVNSSDIDVLVACDTVSFAHKLPSEIQIKSVHNEFSTIKVAYNDITYDIASTRVETYPYSGCLPLVNEVGVDIKIDALRRDFTINSLYLELIYKKNELKFKLIDFFNGVDDINLKTLRVLHNKSYIDDPSRIFRGVGLKYRFGFDFSDYDKKLISEYLLNIDLSNASYSRIFEVLKKILTQDNNFEIFIDLIKNGYYKILFNNEMKFDFLKINNIIKKFKLDNIQRQEFFILLLEGSAVDEIPNFIEPIEYYNYFSKFTIYKLAYIYYVLNNNEILKYFNNKNIKLYINGKVLKDLGYKQGKIFNTILNNLLNEKLKNKNLFKNINDEINYVKKNFPL